MKDESNRYNSGAVAQEKRQLIFDWKRQGQRALASHETHALQLL
jgi:hypothetical protein